MSLTDKGTALVKQCVDQMDRDLNASLQSLTEEENEEFTAALDTVAKYIHELHLRIS